MELDVVIFGGGVAGLWLLHELRRRGHAAVLLDAGELGSGQTVASQGIIHGGLKYSLRGFVDPSARAIRDMPALWRACIQGQRHPDLTSTAIRAEFCWFWSTDSLRSRLGVLGGKVALRSRPVAVPRPDRPDALAAVKGDVYRVDEPVIDPVSLLHNLATPHAAAQIRINLDDGLAFEGTPTQIHAIHLNAAAGTAGQPRRSITLQPRWVVLAAGAGNGPLRERIGLPGGAMQTRPLHMVMVRGDLHHLPVINGHCADGNRTRVTITTATDSAGRPVWQVGGQVAEDGTKMSPDQLLAHTHAELRDALPGVDLKGLEWSTYNAVRAEGVTDGWTRPQGATVLRDGNVMTAWPTKLALAPAMADRVIEQIGNPQADPGLRDAPIQDWPRPQVASPPWETNQQWTRDP